MDDHDIVNAQVGRPLQPPVVVVARCHLGLPTVIRVPPVLADGTPFPTRYWLTCPVQRRAVGGLESEGMVRVFQARRDADPDFGAACAEADADYARERDAALEPGWEGPRPGGGVAGTGGGVKCLHAHLAHHLAGGANPIGREVALLAGNPGCDCPCVGAG